MRRSASPGSEEGVCDHDASSSGYAVDMTKDDGNVDSVLRSIDGFRKDGVLCDVRLCAEDEEFPCHKVILASCSPYFQAMFTSQMAEQAQARVVIKEVKADELRTILDFAYTSTISITLTNVEPLLYAADYFQITQFKDACCRFLEHLLDETNCLGIRRLAETHACVDLEAKAKNCAYSFFEKVMRHEEFLELSTGKLIEFVSSDSLEVGNEELLFEGVVSWLNHSPQSRTEDFETVMKHIRLPLMSPYYLVDKVATTPAVFQNQRCCKLLEEAKTFHLLPDRRRECGGPWTTPRNSSSMVEVAVIVGGHNGNGPVPNVRCYVHSKRKWLSLAPVPHLVYKHGVTAIGRNSLFFVGGERNLEINNAAWCFKPALNSYCKAAPMTYRRQHVSLAALDGFVYAVGATDDEPNVPSVERYSTVGNEWELVKAMEIKLASPAVAASLQGKLFVAGVSYRSDNRTLGCIQCYDPYIDCWQQVGSHFPPMCYSSPCVLNGKLYLIGGWDFVKHTSSPSVICFDPQTETWSACQPMEKGRVSPGVTAMANKIFVFGGGLDANDITQPIDTMDIYDPQTDRWLGKTSMKMRRSWLGCATLNIPIHMLSKLRAK